MFEVVSDKVSKLNKSSLIDEFIFLKKREFGGKIEIESSAKFTWNFYFYYGRLISCDSGYHGNRGLVRQLKKYCQLTDIESAKIETNEKSLKSSSCQICSLLLVLCENGLLKREEAAKIIRQQTRDALFDILQQDNFGSIHYEVDAQFDKSKLDYNLNKAITPINIEHILLKSYRDWTDWQEAGFEFWSPNFAPKIRNKEALAKIVSPTVYQNFIRCINGRNTIRDLAENKNTDTLSIMNSLAPFIHREILSLVEVPDIILPDYLSLKKPVAAVGVNNQNKPLVICIDDSRQICETMKSILTQADYNFYEIKEAIQAVPTLIAKKPDLIFLDIGMPILNGYEICTQIRRVSQLKDIPVVILTGKDGIIDRMRAKMVGATAFMSKPIDNKKVLKITNELITDRLERERQELTESSGEISHNMVFGY